MQKQATIAATDGYTITRRRHPQGYDSMVINTPEAVAEYRLTPGREQAQIAAMRQVLDEHLARPGGTLGDWQWHWACFGCRV